MSKTDLSVQQRPSGLLAILKGDGLRSDLETKQKQALLQRAQRSMDRDRAFLEMGDWEALTARSITGAGNGAGLAVAEIERNQCSAPGVARLLDTSNVGYDRILHRYLAPALH